MCLKINCSIKYPKTPATRELIKIANLALLTISTLSNASISIESNDGIFEGTIMVYVHNTEELEDLITRMRSLDGVLEARRFDAVDEK